MWPLIKILPVKTNFQFVRFARYAAILSAIAVVASLAKALIPFELPCGGLNCGIDFKGGTVLELSTAPRAVELGKLRGAVDRMELGDVQVQAFGRRRSGRRPCMTDDNCHCRRRRVVECIEKTLRQRSAEQFGVGDQVKRMLVVILVIDVIADVVQERRVGENASVDGAPSHARRKRVEQLQREDLHLARVRLLVLASLGELTEAASSSYDRLRKIHEKLQVRALSVSRLSKHPWHPAIYPKSALHSTGSLRVTWITNVLLPC